MGNKILVAVEWPYANGDLHAVISLGHNCRLIFMQDSAAFVVMMKVL